MFNTSKLLDMLRKQFSWVSSLANHTSSDDSIFKVQTVSSEGNAILIEWIQTLSAIRAVYNAIICFHKGHL